MKTSRLNLKGLMCSGCSEIIERAMHSITGISECKVDFDTKQATIQYEPQQVNLDTIQKALASVGYTAQPVDETANSTS